MHDLLQRYCQLNAIDGQGNPVFTQTRTIQVSREVENALASWLRSHFGAQSILLVADKRTLEIAGRRTASALEEAGHRIDLHVLEDRKEGRDPRCDADTIATFQATIEGVRPEHVVAVGAGTVNDIAKMATYRAGIPYSVVATAPSMNGFTSSIAAILEDGVKTTQPAAPPVGAFADPSIMAAAPARMIASGLGDLYSKPVSNADWRLSSLLLGTTHSDIVMEIVEAGSALLEGAFAGLSARNEEAVAKLTGALMLSGLGMQAAGTSGPASGGEHLVSHYIDMTAYGFGQSHDFHGCQVAVGTLVTSRLYQAVMRRSPRDFDLDALVARHPDLPTLESTIHARFGKLAPAVLSHARRGYLDANSLRDRLTLLMERWDEVFSHVRETLRPPEDLENELRAAGCPTTFDELGVDPGRAWRAIVHAKDIRARYTILHLASELGLLERFADTCFEGRPAGAELGPEAW